METKRTLDTLTRLGMRSCDPSEQDVRWLNATFPFWDHRSSFAQLVPDRQTTVVVEGIVWAYLWSFGKLIKSSEKLRDGLLGIGSLPDGSWLIIDTMGRLALEIGSIGLYDFAQADAASIIMGRELFTSFNMTYGEWLQYAMDHPDAGVEFI